MKLGFDFGSKNISYVILDKSKIIFSNTKAHNGDIAGTYKGIINEIINNYNKDDIHSYGITGSIEVHNVTLIDPILTSVEANKFLKTGCKNILSIGSEHFYLVFLDDDLNYTEHIVNPDCASGTGSFIDQQAERIGFTTEELADKAFLYNGNTPSISTRCAVFAKSDIIHSQAQGFSKEAIAAGICKGVARTVLHSTIKGKKLQGQLLFIGGVSNNKMLVSEISNELNMDLVVMENSQVFNAIGAAVIGTETDLNFTKIMSMMTSPRKKRKQLDIALTEYPDLSSEISAIKDGIEISIYKKLDMDNYNLYIGLDIGSTSTKAVILNENKEILAGLYTRTMGDPVYAVSKIFNAVQEIFSSKKTTIRGVGTTGSGRKLIKEIIKADSAINEITAHAKGAAFIDPEVDTIIEIGGQDSKYTLLKNGSVINATMNYVCAAGTGSFIEEQAQRLGITLDEISEMALGQEAPYTSDRCTVYMERDLNILLSEGWNKKEIIAAVLFSVRDNYLSKVVGKSPIGNKIYFQGATGRNMALVAAFEQELQKPILVSKYCHLTGALGCALHVIDIGCSQSEVADINFRYETSSEVCTICPNQCDLRVYNTNGVKTAWGLKCGKEYDDKKKKSTISISNLEKEYLHEFNDKEKIKDNTITIGIPQTLYMVEYHTLFSKFFHGLGLNVLVEKSSSKNMDYGKAVVNSDFCAPMIMAHGLVNALVEKKVDYIFFPAIINEQSYLQQLPQEEKYIDKTTDCYFCYYSQYASTIISNISSINIRDKLISPMIKFNNRSLEQVAEDIADSVVHIVSKSREEIINVFLQTYTEYRSMNKRWKEKGSIIKSSNKNKIKILLLGRPYAVFDEKINLGIPKKIESAGYELLYQSMFDLSYTDGDNTLLEKMHWYYGQQIMLAMESAVNNRDIYPIFLTCFRCSPDSYLLSYFKERMDRAGKPYLVIQLDEHSSDIGYETRIEAALETFNNDYSIDKKSKKSISENINSDQKIKSDDTILLPFISPIITEIQKYVFQGGGYNAQVIPLDQGMINTGYRYTSGGECMPNVAIVGSLIHTIKKEELDPQKICLCLPTLCLACNFNQFIPLIRLACKNAGIEDIKIINPNAIRGIPEMPQKVNVNLLSANILSSLLYKLLFRFRPYEKQKGDTDKALEESKAVIKEYLMQDKPLIEAAKVIRGLFEKIPISDKRKPRIGILGDLYTKYNSILNDDIYSYIENLGGEIVIPSYNEMACHFLYADVLEHDLNKFYLHMIDKQEKKFEQVFSGLIDDSFEPPIEECIDLMHEYGIKHHLIGETTISISRMLYYIKHNIVDAVVHTNPLFCCPGVVSASLFRKIQNDYNVPIIDLFYDGTNKPNKLIVPHLYYLNKQKDMSRSRHKFKA